MPGFRGLPAAAAWQHQDSRVGFEVVFFERGDGGYRIQGTTTAVENEVPWSVAYTIEIDSFGATRRALVTGRSTRATDQVVVTSDGAGHWEVDGRPADALDGCLDVDLESSAMTNAFPVRRMQLAIGDRAAAPAAYVRAADLAVVRLEQTYVRVEDVAGRPRFHYEAPVFDFRCDLVYDEHGLVTTYPGIAARVG
jgi:hypothetical protein